jgi:O-antigen/teichoic acid export membrane protein
MERDIKRIIKSDFGSGSFFTILSVCFLSLSGLFLYFIIAKRYDAYTLGLFNLIYSIYIIASQVGSLGLQTSALFHVAKHSGQRDACNEMISSAVILAVILATFLSSLTFAARNLLADIFKNPDIPMAIVYSLVGLWCFVLNKLFLNVINGFNRMKAYAFFVSFRYLGLIIGAALVIIMNLSGKKISIILSISEASLLIMMLFYSSRLFSFVGLRRFQTWVKRHLAFGIKGSPGLMLSEANTRVDILMLGYFCPETIVGIYSFVAVIIEGINQFPAVLSRNIAPVFTRLIAQNNKEKVRQIVRQGTGLLLPVMFFVAGLGILIYFFVVEYLLGKPEFSSSWIIFAVLMIGAVIKGAYAPFSGILLQAGLPARHTACVLAMILTNIVLNIFLIPVFSIYGAALATSLSFILGVVYLKGFSYKSLGIEI